jgi:hypothetical protein
MLRKFKDEKRQVPLPAAFHIAIEIVRALDFAHSHNVVHRDVSPSNILISRAGEVKIADFGIAVAAQPHRNTGTGPKRVMGKWRYMSPEQTRGDTLDTRSDLFSAAAVIYELFTNEKLFPGEEAEDIIKNIADMPIPRMTTIRPGLPSRLDEVIAGALARKPIDRPTRPATILRSLIELSYESSIMATALDVAEALATVIPAKKMSGRGALDDVIRKQLNEQSVARRTAVTDGKPPSTETMERQGEVSTGLFRKMDMDGVSRLEEAEQAEAEDTRVAAPRARRNSEQVEAMPGDTAAHKLYEQSMDKDRHTEVGGPPTGAVPKNLDVSRSGSMSTIRGPSTSSRAMILAVVAAIVLAIGGGVWALTRNRGESGDNVVTPPPSPDAQVVRTTGTVIVEAPEGAEGYIEPAEDPANRKVLDTALLETMGRNGLQVPAKRLHLHLELAGFSPYDIMFEVRPGETVVHRATMTTAPARLAIQVEPAGVEVTLAGRLLGEAPRTFENLTPGKDLALTLSKAGYQSLTKQVTLEAGKTLELKETLSPNQKFGKLKVEVIGTKYAWGNVHFNKKNWGPNRKTTGPVIFPIPVGTQTITVMNGGKSKQVSVTISEGKLETVKINLD